MGYFEFPVPKLACAGTQAIERVGWKLRVSRPHV